MQQKTNENYQQSLYRTAQLYTGLGYSVIPVHGDQQSQKAKVAATSWKPYQLRRASDQQLKQWFEVEQHGGLGLVLGRISNLIVIDFDDYELQQQFESQFRDLLKTRIVTSANRGLAHYYYALPTYISLPTLHIDGADLLSNGCYVIAPPTAFDGNAYQIQRGGMPYSLTQRDAERLQNFFNDHHQPAYQTLPITEIVPSLPAEDTIQDTPQRRISSQSLIRLYQHYASQIGRNNALFKVARYARDCQMTVVEVSDALKQIHAMQPTYQLHVPETEVQRLKEAERTIKSVFRVPPKPLKSSDNQTLTNSIREALLQRKLTAVARVLDGLYLLGFKSGDVVTKKQVKEALYPYIGRNSILTAFDTVLDDQPVFIPMVSPKPPSDTNVANGKAKIQQTKCYLFSRTKPDKTAGGRVPAQFYVPDVNVLCQQLGVPFTRSDPLTLEDLQQAKTYRQAVYREFIKRRPGMYHRYWLARRLGVSKRTCRRYDKGAKIQRKPMYIYERVSWQTLGRIPTDEPIPGMFLEDGQGKRYPPLRQVAARLLARDHSVRYGYQDMNYYWYGDFPPMIKILYGENPRQEEVDAGRAKTEAYLKQYWADFYAGKHINTVQPQPRPPSQTAGEAIPSVTIPQGTTTLDAVEQSAITDDRADYLAQRLYQAVWDKALNEKSRLSKSNAYNLVKTYGEKLIKRALGVLKHRTNIYNPAGFVVMWLRSTAKVMAS